MIMEDAEMMLYGTLAKIRDKGVFAELANTMTKTITLYTKRFGNKQYAASIPAEEFTNQLLDCVGHLIVADEDAKKLFEAIPDEKDQALIVASISAIMNE
jgi:hypothetical protein